MSIHPRQHRLQTATHNFLCRGFTLIELRKGFSIFESRFSIGRYCARAMRHQWFDYSFRAKRHACQIENPKSKIHHAPRGFTLIELLTVIAIIGILSGLAITGISKARLSAHATKCAANLRQIGTGLHLYMSDSRGGNLPPGDIWDRSITPYLGPFVIPNDDWSRAPLTAWEMCPADKRDPSVRPRAYVASAQLTAYPGVGVFSRSSDIASYNLGDLPTPARTVLICEFFTGAYSGTTQFARNLVRVDGWLAPTGGPRLSDGSRYHGKGQNWLFADGHVALLSDEQAVLGTSDWPNGYWRAYKAP